MENQDALIFESAQDVCYGLLNEDPYIPFTDYEDVQSDRWMTAHDVLLPEECFILGKEYITLEEEYIMGDGTAPCGLKREQHFRDVFEEEATLPEDDSLHHMDQYFRLKTTARQPY